MNISNYKENNTYLYTYADNDISRNTFHSFIFWVGGLPPYGPDSFTGGNAGCINGLPPYGPDSFNGGNGGGSGFINGLPPYGPDSFTGGNAGGSGFINGLPPYGPDSFTGGNSGNQHHSNFTRIIRYQDQSRIQFLRRIEERETNKRKK